MPNFRYQVIDAAGKTSTGVIDAASMADASRKLRADGKFVASLKLDKGAGFLNIGGKKKLKQNSIDVKRKPKLNLLKLKDKLKNLKLLLKLIKLLVKKKLMLLLLKLKLKELLVLKLLKLLS